MRPQTEAELAEIVRAASEPMILRGAGTRPVGHAVRGEVLHLDGLTGITLYEPGALTLVVRAGTPLHEIEETLRGEGQRLAFEPMDHRPLLGTTGTPTIGGVVALNASGPRRIQVGACRDFLLGVRFVDGQGQVITNGGRVMKNVTGYDLVKLMAGSHGTLGALTEVSLKVLPVPETEATVILNGLDTARAVVAMAKALGSPFEVSAAAHASRTADDTPDTMIRIEGFAASVTYRSARLKELLGAFGEISVMPDAPSRAAWARVRDAGIFAETHGDVWRISAKPGDAPDLVERMGADARVQLDWGGGLIWALVPEGTNLRERLGAFAGHATLIRASEGTRAALPVFHPQPAALRHLERGMRERFDPRGLFNRGLMGHDAA